MPVRHGIRHVGARLALTLAALGANLLWAAPPAQAAPGDVDFAFAGFGLGGALVTSHPSNWDLPVMAVQPDGKIVLAGQDALCTDAGSESPTDGPDRERDAPVGGHAHSRAGEVARGEPDAAAGRAADLPVVGAAPGTTLIGRRCRSRPPGSFGTKRCDKDARSGSLCRAAAPRCRVLRPGRALLRFRPRQGPRTAPSPGP